MSGASGPDPWGSNRHASRPQSGSGSRPDPVPPGPRKAGPSATGGWAANSAQAGSPRSWAPTGSTAGTRQLVGPPYAYLWTSIAAALVALVLALLSQGFVVLIIAWAIAGFGGFGAAVVFVQRDALRQTETFYLRDPRAPWIYRAAILLSLIAVIATAVRVALIVGRMG